MVPILYVLIVMVKKLPSPIFLKCYCSEFFDPHFFSLIKSAFLPDLFTTNRIEIGQFKPIL
jgi:hypothetical protein